MDHTRQTALVVKVVPHPEFCRDEGGSIKTLVESKSPLRVYATRSLSKIPFLGFDFATCKLSHALTITQWVAPLQLIHAVKVLQGSYKAYLKKQYIYVVGMGMCNRTVQCMPSCVTKSASKQKDVPCRCSPSERCSKTFHSQKAGSSVQEEHFLLPLQVLVPSLQGIVCKHRVPAKFQLHLLI